MTLPLNLQQHLDQQIRTLRQEMDDKIMALYVAFDCSNVRSCRLCAQYRQEDGFCLRWLQKVPTDHVRTGCAEFVDAITDEDIAF